jgi:hypothetical protein
MLVGIRTFSPPIFMMHPPFVCVTVFIIVTHT